MTTRYLFLGQQKILEPGLLLPLLLSDELWIPELWMPQKGASVPSPRLLSLANTVLPASDCPPICANIEMGLLFAHRHHYQLEQSQCEK